MMAMHFTTFTNMVGQGIVLGTVLETVRPDKKWIGDMWKSDGPDRGHHLPNFYQHGLVRDCL